MRSIQVKAPAKLNLFLYINARRKDGYHSLLTLFEKISLFDILGFTRRSDSRIRLVSDSPDIPLDKNNLVYKAVCLLRQHFKVNSGVTISIKKNIPVGAGLGGGSSDAAAALLAVAKLWKLDLSDKTALKMALSLGADVPFFLDPASFALAEGIGEKLRPLRTDSRLWHVVGIYSKPLATRRVYALFDKLMLSRARVTAALTKRPGNDKILNLPFKGIPRHLTRLFDNNYNSLEQAASFLFPQIKEYRDKLSSLGLENIGMSGSGPSVFAIVNSQEEGQRARRKLCGFKGWKSFVVSTF